MEFSKSFPISYLMPFFAENANEPQPTTVQRGGKIMGPEILLRAKRRKENLLGTLFRGRGFKALP
jgi:hypothetical protein